MQFFLNEWIFAAHIALMVGSTLVALRLGRTALVAMVTLQAVMANLFVVKQMTLFGFQVTCSDVYAIGCMLSLNLLQEYYGSKEALKAARLSLFCMLFFAGMAKVHLAYAPNAYDASQAAFQTIFASSWRLFLASIATYFTVQMLDLSLFGWLRRKLQGKIFGIRLISSLGFSQIVDTCLFSFLGLYGLVPSMMDIILVSLFVKWCAIVALIPFTWLSRHIAKAEAG